MNQNYRGAPRRGGRLNERQHQRILMERRMRVLRRRLYICVTALVVLVAVLIAVLFKMQSVNSTSNTALVLEPPEVTATVAAEATVESTEAPTEEPSPTATNTAEPTQESTAEPTVEPTAEPTAEPTEAPTAQPTVGPTPEPETEEASAEKAAPAIAAAAEGTAVPVEQPAPEEESTPEEEAPAEEEASVEEEPPVEEEAPAEEDADAGAEEGENPEEDAADEADQDGEEAAENLASFDPSAPFSFESAYAAAVQGAYTGEVITPDYEAIDPEMLDRWPSADEGYLPLLDRARTNEDIIAVTVDDCFQVENLHQIVQCALDNDAGLTIFPIGSNLEREAIANEVRWAWDNGMEIENHTYSHGGTYHYDDAGMADDIWRQSYLLNQVLGVNYKQHFFRPKGGDERFDQRTHAYANQFGFSAFALWTESGSQDSVDRLLSNLAPGRIYLFHTTDKDREKLLEFIPAAVERGYRLVTLNEMFGLPENETSDLTTASTEAPALQNFQVTPVMLKATSYSRAAAVVQKRLIELGWMRNEATGVYGKTTQACVRLFQIAAGLSADGIAGTHTQQALFSEDAPKGSTSLICELAMQLNSESQAIIWDMLEG